MLDKIDLTKALDKKTYKQVMPELSGQLFSIQKASWDAGVPVVILFEGWDAAGKGTSIRKITTSLDPRGYKLYPIRMARTYEKKHPWLWRFWLKTPAEGEWAIFDRSWYGRVMVERVENLIPENEWRRAYREISEFERTLADDGAVIFKFFLHISKKEQKRRFDKITKDPLTAWQVTTEDWGHHRRYNDWLLAYEEAFERTDSEYGPWTIVEATDRRYTWVKIYQTIITALSERLKMPMEPLPVNIEQAAQVGSEEISTDAEFGLAANFEDELEHAATHAGQDGPGGWVLEEALPVNPTNPGDSPATPQASS
jgi:polyphosphate kinase 2 (PPK2 family)